MDENLLHSISNIQIVAWSHNFKALSYDLTVEGIANRASRATNKYWTQLFTWKGWLYLYDRLKVWS